MKKRIVLCTLIAFAGVSFAQTGETPAAAPKTVTAGKFTMTYTIEGTNLVASVTAPVTGWIAVGFNPSKMMKDANINIGYADGATSVVQDQFGSGMFSHKPDSALGGKNDLTSASCIEKDGTTTLSFTIPLDSGDKNDTKLVPGQKVKLIFAASTKDDISKKHSITGKTETTL
jgi:hypothetical protein